MQRNGETFFLRQPVFGEFQPPTPLLADDQVQDRVFDNAMATWGLASVLHLPPMPLTGYSLQSLVRRAFRHPRSVEPHTAVQHVGAAIAVVVYTNSCVVS